MSKIKRKLSYSVVLIVFGISFASSQPSSVVISTQQSKEGYSQDFVQHHNKCQPIQIPYVLFSCFFKDIFINENINFVQ